jgi:glycosyltransferase involved in cell wall biosynthesis
MKRTLLRAVTSIAISRAVAEHVGGAVVVPNPYRDHIFRRRPEVARTRDLVFVGRLVSDKGVDVLLHALAILKNRGMVPGLSVIGRGPDEGLLRNLAVTLGVAGQVHFEGAKEGEELARRLNESEVMVIPSLWKEPFGVVALEGIASGCVLVASEGGGLADAVGACGVLVPNGDVAALADALEKVLTSSEVRARCRAAADEHLERHRAESVARGYLDVLLRVAPLGRASTQSSPYGSEGTHRI